MLCFIRRCCFKRFSIDCFKFFKINQAYYFSVILLFQQLCYTYIFFAKVKLSIRLFLCFQANLFQDVIEGEKKNNNKIRENVIFYGNLLVFAIVDFFHTQILPTFIENSLQLQKSEWGLIHRYFSLFLC